MKRWHAIWTWCARLSCAPWFLGSAVLAAHRGAASWVPLAAVFLACWVGLALALSGLFGLIALRAKHAEEHLPWELPTFVAGVAGLVGSMIVGAVAVVMLSAIDVS